MQARLLWLVRRTKGEIIGPMEFAELKKKFTKGEVAADSEFCPENGYWFTLGEIEELKKYFTPDEIASALRHYEKVHATGESTQSDLTKSDLGRTGLVAAGHGRKKAGQVVAAREKDAHKPVQPVALERGHIFGIVFFVGVIGAILAVIWILHRLNQT